MTAAPIRYRKVVEVHLRLGLPTEINQTSALALIFCSFSLLILLLSNILYSVKRHFLSGVNGGLQSVTVESNGILYSQAAGCQQYNGMFS